MLRCSDGLGKQSCIDSSIRMWNQQGNTKSFQISLTNISSISLPPFLWPGKNTFQRHHTLWTAAWMQQQWKNVGVAAGQQPGWALNLEGLPLSGNNCSDPLLCSEWSLSLHVFWWNGWAEEKTFYLCLLEWCTRGSCIWLIFSKTLSY